MNEEQRRAVAAFNASGQRLVPVAIGVIYAVAVAVAAPNYAAKTFFPVAAQIIPVLLLALVIEARLFGSPRRASDNPVAGHLEVTRRVLEFTLLVALVLAESQAIVRSADDSGGSPLLVYGGLAGGFVTVAAIAIWGTGRARVTADLKLIARTGAGVLVQIGANNEFGDRPVEPLMNVLVEGSAAAIKTTITGAPLPAAFDLPGHAPVTVDGRTINCRYYGERTLLTPGDANVSYLTVVPNETPALIVVRLDHATFRRGRVEAASFVPPKDGPLEHVRRRTG